jgi:hypothetical protein
MRPAAMREAGMSAKHNVLHDAQLPLLKVAALWFDMPVILDSIGASRNTNGLADRDVI